MPHSLADVHAAGAVDVALDLVDGSLSWRDLGGGVVARARCAAVLLWSPNARTVQWSIDEVALARAGAPVVAVPQQAAGLVGPVGAAGVERLARDAAAEAGWPELLRVNEAGFVRFVAVDEVVVSAPPVGPSRRLRGLAALARRGDDLDEVAGRVRAEAEQLRQRPAQGLEGLLLSGLALDLERNAARLDADPVGAAAGLEAVAHVLHEGRPPDLGTPGHLLAALRRWQEGSGRDPALEEALSQAVQALAQDPEVLTRTAALVAAARAEGLPLETLADALRRLAPPGPASAGLWRALAAATPPRAELVTLFNLGLSLRAEAGAPQAALDLFARALDLDPEDAELWFELGNARRDLGDGEGAVAAWTRASGLEPALPGPWAGLGSHLLGAGRYEEARRALSRLVLLSDEAEHWHGYGQALQGCGRSEQAREALERAEAGYGVALARGEDPRLRYRRGAVRARLGRVAAALVDLQAAAEAQPEWAARAQEDPDYAALRALPGWAWAPG